MKAAQFLAKAISLVGGDRQATHGPKERNHDNIAVLWNAYLKIRREPDAELDCSDIATMMALLKIARMELGEFNPDDAVDGAAYLAIRGELDAA